MSAFTFSALWVVFICAAGTLSSARSVPSITVDYTIANDLLGEPFKYSIRVSVPAGSVLLDVMEKAHEMNPKDFSFSTESTSWGPFVTSIHGLIGSTNDKTYWQFLDGKAPLNEGVGTYKPKDGEHILAIFSKY